MRHSNGRHSRRTLLWSWASLPVTALLAVLMTAMASGEGIDPPDAERVAWRYTQKELTVTITHTGGKAWVAHRSDGTRPEYDEVERTGDYVQLQNRETKLLVRLHADQAYWRRPKDTDWTRWVKGAWVPAPAPPAPALSGATTRPAAGEHRVRLAYFVPRDRKPVRQYEQRIRNVMATVAEVYLRDLRAKGCDTDGLRFVAEKGEPAVQLVRGDRDASHYNNAPRYNAQEQWRRLAPEIKAKVADPHRQVVVVFAETYDDGPAEHLWPGVLALGAYHNADGGLGIFSAHLLRDEFSAATPEAHRRLFFDETPVRGRKAWGHKMSSPRGTFVEDGTGAVAHELGHAFGLPHDHRDDARDLMGNGFRNLRWNFPTRPAPGGAPGAPPNRVGFSDDNARLLMSSRYFARDPDLADTDPPRAEVTSAARDKGAWAVTVKASDNAGLRAIVFVDRTGGSVAAGRALKGKTQEIHERLVNKDAASGLKLQVIVTDVGGNQARIQFDSSEGQ